MRGRVPLGGRVSIPSSSSFGGLSQAPGSFQVLGFGSSLEVLGLRSVLFSNRRTSLWIGRFIEDTGLVLLPLLETWQSPNVSFTLRSSQSFLLLASVTRASCHCLRGVSSLMITMSLNSKFRLGAYPFWTFL